MSKFNFKPCFTADGDVTKTDLPHGLSLMTYIAADDYPYSAEQLLGDEWEFVRLPCLGFRTNPRTNEVLQRLGVDSEGKPDLEALLDNHTEAVLKTVRELTKSLDGGFSELQESELIERLRNELYKNSIITEHLLDLWNTGLAIDPKVLRLDVYSHSGETWSFTGEGEQCRWDTAVCAGVLLPSEDMSRQLDELGKTDPRDMAVIARENARDYLKGFKLWNQGLVYQIVGELVETATGQEIDNREFPEIVGGYLGIDHAQENFEDALRQMKTTTVELAEARNLAWRNKLHTAAQEIVKKLGLVSGRVKTSKDDITDVLASHFQPPKDFNYTVEDSK